MYETFLS